MNKRLFLLATYAAVSTLTAYARLDQSPGDDYDNPFAEIQSYFDEEMERIDRQFDTMRRAMRQGLRNNVKQQGVRIGIHENDDRSAAQVIVSGLELKDQTFDASYNHEAFHGQPIESILTIATPAGDIKIQAYNRYVGVGFSKLEKKESKDKQSPSTAVMSWQSQTGRTVSGDMLLEQADIEYDELGKTVRVTIPYKKKASTKIPVTIKRLEAEK